MAQASELTRFQDIAHALHLHSVDEQDAARLVISAIRELYGQLDQPCSVAELGIDQADYEKMIETLCEFAEGDGTYISGVRVPEREDLRKLFLCAYDGQTVDF